MPSVVHSSVAAPAPTEAAELSEYGRAVRRHWWVVLLGVLAGGAVASAYLVFAPRSYTSIAKVQVTDTGVADSTVPAGARINTANIDMDTEARIVTSTSVAALAATMLKTSISPVKLASMANVTVPPNSAILYVAYHASNPTAARLGAQAFAESYLTTRRDIAQGLLASEIMSLQARMPALNRQLQTLTTQTATFPTSSPQWAYAQDEEGIVRTQIDSLNAAIDPLRQQMITPGQLLTPASLPATPSSPKRTAVLLSGGLVGLLAGEAFALASVRRDRRIRRKKDVSDRLGLPVLAEFIDTQTSTDPMSPDGSAAPERELRDRLVAGAFASCVLVVPLSDAATGSAVAAKLSRSLCADGASCVLVCAAPDSACAQLLSVSTSPGLSDALAAGRRKVGIPVIDESGRQLMVIPPGTDSATLIDRLHGPEFLEFVRHLRRSYDHVVIEAPPWASTRHALVLGRAAQGAVLVAEAGRETHDTARDAAQRLSDAGSTVLGIVLVARAGQTRQSAAANEFAASSAQN